MVELVRGYVLLSIALTLPSPSGPRAEALAASAALPRLMLRV